MIYKVIEKIFKENADRLTKKQNYLRFLHKIINRKTFVCRTNSQKFTRDNESSTEFDPKYRYITVKKIQKNLITAAIFIFKNMVRKKYLSRMVKPSLYSI